MKKLTDRGTFVLRSGSTSSGENLRHFSSSSSSDFVHDSGVKKRYIYYTIFPYIEPSVECYYWFKEGIKTTIHFILVVTELPLKKLVCLFPQAPYKVLCPRKVQKIWSIENCRGGRHRTALCPELVPCENYTLPLLDYRIR